MKRRSGPRARGITGARYAENLRKLEIRHGQVVTVWHTRRSNQLHAIQTAENLAQQKEIERLRLNVSETGERIAKAEEQTSLNQKQAAQANENAEKARKQAAELLLQQEQLKQENMQTAMALQLESTERKKGQAELSDRSINSARLKDEMSKYAGTRVLIEYIDTPEAQSLAHEIQAGLTWARWLPPHDPNLPEWTQFSVLMSQPLKPGSLADAFTTGGVAVCLTKNEYHDAGTALWNELMKQHTWTRIIGSGWKSGVVHVIIGAKPLVKNIGH